MSELVGETVYGDSISEEAAKEEEIIKKQLMKGEVISTSSNSVWEIQEECSEYSSSTNEVRLLASIEEEFDDHNDVIYVGVGNGNSSSMDALVWSLANITINNNSAPLVYLIHVFPETRFIPTPLGKLAISQVNPQQKETYLNQERSKRKDFLHKFLNVCSASKVNADTILIESDFEAKALIDLIPILNIRKLVLGTSKSSLRKLRSKKGNGIVDQVVRNAPRFCEVKVICEGALVDTVDESPSPSPSPSPSQREADVHPTQTSFDEQNASSFGCCFKSKFIR